MTDKNHPYDRDLDFRLNTYITAEMDKAIRDFNAKTNNGTDSIAESARQLIQKGLDSYNAPQVAANYQGTIDNKTAENNDLQEQNRTLKKMLGTAVLIGGGVIAVLTFALVIA